MKKYEIEMETIKAAALSGNKSATTLASILATTTEETAANAAFEFLKAEHNLPPAAAHAASLIAADCERGQFLAGLGMIPGRKAIMGFKR